MTTIYKKRREELSGVHNFKKRKNINLEDLLKENKSKYRLYDINKKTGKLITIKNEK